MATVSASPGNMLSMIEEKVQLGIQYLQEKNVHFNGQFFLDKFEAVEKATIADTRFSAEVPEALNLRKPCLVVAHCDVSTFVPKQEVYLVDIHALATVKKVHDDDHMCLVEVTAIGLDDTGHRCPLSDVLHWKRLVELRREWDQMKPFSKKSILTECLGVSTAVAVYKGTLLPHDYASHTEAIRNQDLVELLFDASAFYSKLSIGSPGGKSCFQYVSGPPGCGKTTAMLKQIEQFRGRKLVAAHSNLLERELYTRMIKQTDVFTSRMVVFLGPSLRDENLPDSWHCWTPFNMNDDQIESIVAASELLVIGTVKKIDDLRHRCQSAPGGGRLEFDAILHDEFARQQWLDLYTVAKVCTATGAYTAYGDPKQTKVHIEEDVWQHPYQSSEESMRGYRAAVAIQSDLWSEYLRWQETHDKRATRELKMCMEGPTSLLVNRRSHPNIVDMFSKAYYDSRMKSSPDWSEPTFAFPTLEHRVIFVHHDSSSAEAKADQKTFRNDAELLATTTLTTALVSCGVAEGDIMLLSAYALHAHRMRGLTVASAQGSENTVVIYNVVAYGMASDSAGKLSLRGDVFNTAGTRAKSLFLVVADTQQIIRQVQADSGLRRLMSWSPIIPLQQFVATLPNVELLNKLLATTYASKKQQQSRFSSKKEKVDKKRKHQA